MDERKVLELNKQHMFLLDASNCQVHLQVPSMHHWGKATGDGPFSEVMNDVIFFFSNYDPLSILFSSGEKQVNPPFGLTTHGLITIACKLKLLLSSV